MSAELLHALGPSSGSVWRVVENQQQAATRQLTGSLAEQSRLEELLDANKPAWLPGSEHQHCLLKTPFRYPPLRHGSRFGAAHLPGILYGSCELTTALTESAVYLWLFRAGPAEPGPLQQIRSSRTALNFPVTHERSSDLTRAELADHHQQISAPHSYAFSQALGAQLREAGAAMIWFFSARLAGGSNCAVLNPSAIPPDTVPLMEQWQFQLDDDSCWWYSPMHGAREVLYRDVAAEDGVIAHPVV